MYQITTAVRKINALDKRLRIIQGGSSAGKTIATLLILINIAQDREKYGVKLISIVSESMPHLKRGAIRDFLSIMEAHGYFKEDNWNRTDMIYTFETGSRMEFFSADQPGKVRGPRRDILFVNEANNISYETYTQLVIRTNEYIYLDYNPVVEFWVHNEVIPTQDHDFLILTYKDNEGLPDTIVQELESRRKKKNWWLVYGLGQLGEVEGKIYKGWREIDDIPHEAKKVRYWLDFGYSNDPTSIGAVYKYNNGYILDEIAYQKGLSNKQIADILLNQEDTTLTIADSAEPKSIDEIKSYGVTIIGAEKGRDSVSNGIQLVQDQRISITKRSINTLKEYRSYMWMIDKDGKILNIPEGIWDHSMSGIRYAVTSLIRPEDKGVSIYRPKEAGYAPTILRSIGGVKINSARGSGLNRKY